MIATTIQIEEKTLVRFSVAFTEQDEVTPIDPSVVTLYYIGPNDVSQQSEQYPGNVVKDSVGNYHFDVDVEDDVGDWYSKWQATGAVELTTPDVLFQVRASMFTLG